MDLLRSILWNIALIPVTPSVEPADFDVKVRKPGVAFLNTTPHPNASAWRNHQYWRRALGDLLTAYKNICSYSGSWTKVNVSGITTPQDSSVDHFKPKSTAPAEAYEWANFRLSRMRLNNRKGNHTDVLDPFILPNGWFTLDFRSFLIRPSQTLSKSDKGKVQKTIDRLELNTDSDYVQERVTVIQEYCVGTSTLAMLEKLWPFIAREMRIQDFDSVFLPSMRAGFRARLGSSRWVQN